MVVRQTESGEKPLFLFLSAIRVDGVHDKGGLDTEGAPVATVYPVAWCGRCGVAWCGQCGVVWSV